MILSPEYHIILDAILHHQNAQLIPPPPRRVFFTLSSLHHSLSLILLSLSLSDFLHHFFYLTSSITRSLHYFHLHLFIHYFFYSLLYDFNCLFLSRHVDRKLYTPPTHAHK